MKYYSFIKDKERSIIILSALVRVRQSWGITSMQQGIISRGNKAYLPQPEAPPSSMHQQASSML